MRKLNLNIVVLATLFIMLAGIQYTLSKILFELREVKKISSKQNIPK